jgi:hypothetical protein
LRAEERIELEHMLDAISHILRTAEAQRPQWPDVIAALEAMRDETSALLTAA